MADLACLLCAAAVATAPAPEVQAPPVVQLLAKGINAVQSTAQQVAYAAVVSQNGRPQRFLACMHAVHVPAMGMALSDGTHMSYLGLPRTCSPLSMLPWSGDFKAVRAGVQVPAAETAKTLADAVLYHAPAPAPLTAGDKRCWIPATPHSPASSVSWYHERAFDPGRASGAAGEPLYTSHLLQCAAGR